jgi:hypothetical protein
MESFLLSIITFGAAAVNGALGYGFSSLTVPLALLFMTSRTLNPALVLLEVGLNANVLFTNRRGLESTWSHSLPIVLGLAPGIVIGTLFLANVSALWIKLVTYCVLLPLVVAQAAGLRHAFRSARTVGVAAGVCLGVLYAITTISGPPLALLLANQGLAKREFRAALGLVRIVESTVTAIAYFYMGMITMTSVRLALLVLPGVVVAVPLGAMLVKRVNPESFRRICASLNAWVIALGLSAVLQNLHLVNGPAAYSALAVVVTVDCYLLRRFFSGQRNAAVVNVPAV